MFENQKYGKRVKEFSEMWEALRNSFIRHPLSEKISDSANKFMAHSLWCNGENAVPEKLLKNSKIVLKLLALCLNEKCKKKIAADKQLDDFLKGDFIITEEETDTLYKNARKAEDEVKKIKPIFWSFHEHLTKLGLSLYKDYRAYAKTDFEFKKEINEERQKMENIKEKEVVHEGKKVDIATTMSNIIHNRRVPSIINQDRLEEVVKEEPEFIIEAAKFVRADIAYLT